MTSGKISVAFVTNGLSRWGGGIPVVIEALSAALGEIKGVDVRVFGLSDPEWEKFDRHRWRGAPAVALPISGPKPLGYAPRMLRELMAWQPDVVHSHGLWMHASRSVLQWARSTGRPYLVSPHGMLDAWAVRNSAMKKRIAGVLYQYAHLRGAAALQALCEPEAAAIAAFGLRNPVHVIPNGIDLPAAKTMQSERHENPREPRVMLYRGRLHPQKNLLALIQAWAMVRARPSEGPNWRLVIAGWDKDGHEAALRAAAKKFAIEGEIDFLGPLFGSEKDAAFRNASAFILPSLSEGLPMTVLEACSYGLPVLMTDACNLRDGFALGAAHRLDVAPEGMAANLSSYLSLPDEKQSAIGARGYAWVQRDFTWSAIARQIADVYRATVEASKSSASGCLARP
jgi:poly(glycerol-phosphate) alpha-glucosyltransferase